MPTLVIRTEIAMLKRRARTALATMRAIGDTMDCGHQMACEISGSYLAASLRYDEAMAKLRKLDPDFPEGDVQ